MPEDKFYTKGVYLYTQKKYKKAIENFDKVLQINPDFVYYALIPKRKGQSIKPLFYNKEKMLKVEDYLVINSLQ